jgi:hypothetical protein
MEPLFPSYTAKTPGSPTVMGWPSPKPDSLEVKNQPQKQEATMSTVTAIGINVAKNSFHVYGMNEYGAKAFSKALTRAKISEFFASHPQCLVGMEACASSSYWQRVIE